MTTNSRMIRWAVFAATTALTCGACRSEAVEPAVETTIPTATTELPAGPTLEDWALQVESFIDHQNSGLKEVREIYEPQFTHGSDQLAIEVAWLRADAAALSDEAPPAVPEDKNLSPLYESLLNEQDIWVETFRSTADALEAESAAIMREWASGLNPRRIALTEPAYKTVGTAQQACSELADAIIQVADVSLDCVNQYGATPTEPAEATVGDIGLLVTAGPLVNVRQEGPTAAFFQDPNNIELMVQFSSEPTFADPSGDLLPQKIVDGTSWPTNTEAWITSVGADLIDTGATTVSGYDTQHWRFVVADGEPVVAVLSFDGLPTAEHGMQISPGAVLDLYRIETPGQPTMMLVRGFDRERTKVGMPPSFPTPEEAADWVKSLAIKISAKE